jgi:hypothetical protein
LEKGPAGPTRIEASLYHAGAEHVKLNVDAGPRKTGARRDVPGAVVPVC